MTSPNSVIKNLEVLTLPSITDEESKGTYLSPTNLNAKKLKVVESLLRRRSKKDLEIIFGGAADGQEFIQNFV